MNDGKSGAYSAPAESQDETIEKLNRKVTAEIRHRVRRFVHAEPFTAPWKELLEPLKFLSAVAEQEDQHARDTVTKGPPAAAATVWEREEVCIRTIIEEGKMNLIARCLREIKEISYAGGIPDDMVAEARAYEESLGVILRCALEVIECLQTLDLGSLLEHCHMCLSHAVTDNAVKLQPCDVPLAQEFLAIRYLHSVFKRVEKLHPDAIVSKVVDLGLVLVVLKHLEKYRVIVDQTTQHAYLLFFVGLVDTEYFLSKPTTVFPTAESRRTFATLMGPLVAAYVALGPDQKKVARPVSDLVVRWK